MIPRVLHQVVMSDSDAEEGIEAARAFCEEHYIEHRLSTSEDFPPEIQSIEDAHHRFVTAALYLTAVSGGWFVNPYVYVPIKFPFEYIESQAPVFSITKRKYGAYPKLDTNLFMCKPGDPLVWAITERLLRVNPRGADEVQRRLHMFVYSTLGRRGGSIILASLHSYVKMIVHECARVA